MLEKNFQKENTLYQNLKKIKGISNFSASYICTKLGVDQSILFKNLSKKKLNKLSSILTNLKRNTSNNFTLSHSAERNSIEKKILIDRNLSIMIKENIQKLIQLNTYRGRRIKYGYPAHGQRTSSNAKTVKKIGKTYLKIRR